MQACGSGGTSAGICLGAYLAWKNPPVVHAYGVCDTPDYFFDYIDGLLMELGVWGPGGAAASSSSVPSARGLLRVVQVSGAAAALTAAGYCGPGLQSQQQ